MTLFLYCFVVLTIFCGIFSFVRTAIYAFLNSDVHHISVTIRNENDVEYYLRRLMRIFPAAVIHVRGGTDADKITYFLARKHCRIVQG